MTKSLGIRARRAQWTDDQVEYLRRHYADGMTRDAAKALGLPIAAVLRKASALGLAKTTAAIAETARRRSSELAHGGSATRFRKKHTPWNKGLSYPSTSPATLFSPGSRPQNWVPVGSYRIRGGYLDLKTHEPGDHRYCWQPVHRLVWVEANGPVPAGHIVVFKPGRKTTELDAITLDAVELITRAENMTRNSVHQLPPELALLVQLRGVLNKTINRRAEEAETP